MECSLCKRQIWDYDARFNHLDIDEAHYADICNDCIDKFSKWQARIIAELFPTKMMKKRFDRS